MNSKTYHGLNAHTVGIIIKEAVKRATCKIRQFLPAFEVSEKPSDYKAEDQVTNADYAAQKVIVKVLEENMPLAGIVAEESGLKRSCTSTERQLYFTVDPLDGTRAFVRKQSDGIGSMIALIEVDDEQEHVIAACVGDVMTQELYYYRPESDSVHRFSTERHEVLTYEEKKHRRLMMLDDVRSFPPIYQALSDFEQGYYHSISVVNGSIGTNFARLWKGEVDAIILKAQRVTPWDVAPVYGISKKLGFVFLELVWYADEKEIMQYNFQEQLIDPLKTAVQPNLLIIHRSQIKNLADWMIKYNKLSRNPKVLVKEG